MSTIQVRVDDDLKSKADALFKELGIDTTSAIRMFLTQAVAYDGIPFEIKKFNKTKEMKIMTEDEFLDRLASSRVQSREGKVIDADIAIDSIRNKYYKVIFTENAMEDMDSIVEYLLFHLRNKQAANHFIDSVKNGKFVLSNSAESFQLCLNPRLRSKGYRRLNLDKTKYFLLYRIENSIVFIDGIYHQLQDYENKIK